jgi:hypothetical protein
MEVRSVEAIVRALNGAGVEYLIVGGLAVSAHGYERLTVDVDLVVGLQSENITLALRTLSAAGWRMSIPVTPEEFANPKLREHCGVTRIPARRLIFLFMSRLISKKNLRAPSGNRWREKSARRLSPTRRFWP